MKNNRISRTATRTVTAVGLLWGVGFSVSAGAQVAAPAEADAWSDSGQLEEIVVTAQRRAERLQDVPIAVNVLTGTDLTERGVSGPAGLQAIVPGLDMAQTGAANSVFLRGVGTTVSQPSTEQSVALYVDGVYFASPYSSMFDFNNIERVEVLKGPQGTLFGRNATGGVIQMVTRDPQHITAVKAELGYANYETLSGNLYATGGISDDAAIDIAARFSHQNDGWGRNVNLGTDAYKGKDYSVRSKLLLNLGENTEVRFGGNYAFLENDFVAFRGTQGTVQVDGQMPPSGKYDNRGDVGVHGKGQPRSKTDSYGGFMRIDHDFDTFRLTSITAGQATNNLYTHDSDATPLLAVTAILPTHQENYSQELQAQSADGSAFDWTVGVFLYQNTGDTSASIFRSPTTETKIASRIRTRSASVYGQATVEVIEGTRVTVGARYTKERTTADYAINGTDLPDFPARKFNRLTWRLALDQAFTDDIHGYVSYNRGVKGSGFDYVSPSAGYDPETVDAYEIGLKSQLFDRRARVNLSVFQNNFRDIQIVTVPSGTTVTANAAKARIRGFDGDIAIRPVENLTLSFTFGYLDGKYLDFKNAQFFERSPLDGPSRAFDASGFDTIRTPKFTGSANADYRIPIENGEVFLSGTVTRNSGYAFSVDNEFRQPSYTLLNASVGWKSEGDRLGVRVWGKNLTKEYYYSSGSKSAFGENIVPAAPRTYGVTVSTSF